MKFPVKIIVFYFILTTFIMINFSHGQESQQPNNSNDSLYTALLINHLRQNFDDIHDVSMRFHHLDYNLNGIIQIKMNWEKGKLTSASATKNETNNKEFANALIQNLKKWTIKDLVGPYEINLPFNIKIVGSDDSTFFEKGILTGEIYDQYEKPLSRVRLDFKSVENPADTLINCYTNREGVFVKTLIPIGKWNITFSVNGFEDYNLENVSFKKGDHIRNKIVMQPNGE